EAHIARAMQDPSPLVRAAAAAAAAEGTLTGLIAPMKELLKDSDASVVSAAITAGNSLGDTGFATAGLEHADPMVVITAMRAASTPEHANAIAMKLPSLPVSGQ